VSGDQPVPPGAPLPLLARIGRARKPAARTGQRRDGTVVDVLATLGVRRKDGGDVSREDQVRDWAPWP
jgi:hypothetical protein